MIRSLIAILIAVVMGMITAKFIEGMGAAAFPLDVVDAGDIEGLKAAAANAPFGYKATLITGWGVAAFIAAAIALAIGKRWAPLGWLSAGVIFLLSFITLIGLPFGLWLLPLSLIVTMGCGWLSIKLLKATYALETKSTDGGLFS